MLLQEQVNANFQRLKVLDDLKRDGFGLPEFKQLRYLIDEIATQNGMYGNIAVKDFFEDMQEHYYDYLWLRKRVEDLKAEKARLSFSNFLGMSFNGYQQAPRKPEADKTSTTESPEEKLAKSGEDEGKTVSPCEEPTLTAPKKGHVIGDSVKGSQQGPSSPTGDTAQADQAWQCGLPKTSSVDPDVVIPGRDIPLDFVLQYEAVNRESRRRPPPGLHDNFLKRRKLELKKRIASSNYLRELQKNNSENGRTEQGHGIPSDLSSFVDEAVTKPLLRQSIRQGSCSVRSDPHLQESRLVREIYVEEKDALSHPPDHR